MDEARFRQAHDAMNTRACAFAKALLAGACACPLAERQYIAEREAVACGAPEARVQCAALRAALRQNSTFALKLTQVDARLPHAKEMKLQCGGLLGVQRVLAPAEPSTERSDPGSPAVADVHGLVEAARRKFGGLENLPYSAIVQSIVTYPIRRRRLPQ